jgi:hypothetical protein
MCIINLRYELQLNEKSLATCGCDRDKVQLLIQRSYLKDLIIIALEQQLNHR